MDDNTILFVIIHELAHVMSLSVGHTEEFWSNMKFLLEQAESINLYDQLIVRPGNIVLYIYT